MKLAPVLVIAAMAGPAFAEDVVDPVPKPTGLQVGIRIPWDVTVTPGVVGVGMASFGLDLGERVSSRVYVGVMADYMLVLNIRDDSGIEHRFRGGVEGRYYFHEGTANVTSGGGDCCCGGGETRTVARYDWVGLRLGEETIDEFTTRGTFADLSIGTDAQLGPSVELGVYLSAGLTSEPASAYAATTDTPFASRAATTPDGASATSYYFTLGFHMGFGG